MSKKKKKVAIDESTLPREERERRRLQKEAREAALYARAQGTEYVGTQAVRKLMRSGMRKKEKGERPKDLMSLREETRKKSAAKQALRHKGAGGR
jgi:hypothetical protein